MQSKNNLYKMPKNYNKKINLFYSLMELTSFLLVVFSYSICFICNIITNIAYKNLFC